MREAPRPKDRNYLVFLTFITLGVASLLPFNVVLCQSYFYYWRSHAVPYFAPVADNFLALMANSFTVANLLGLAALIRYGQHIPLHWQITGPIWAITGLLVSQALSACSLGLSGNVIMLTSGCVSALLGATSSVLVAGAYGLASKFPPRYTQAVVVGQAGSGLAISLLAALTIWLNPPDPTRLPEPRDLRGPALAYFVGAACIMLATLTAYSALPSLEYVQHHLLEAWMAPWDAQEGEGEQGSQALQPLLEGRPVEEAATGPASLERPSPAAAVLVRQSLRRPSVSAAAVHADAELPPDAERGKPAAKQESEPRLMQRLRGFPLLVALTFGTSFFVLPGFMMFLSSTQPLPAQGQRARLYGDLFVPFIFVLFNLGDSLGRLAAGLSRTAPATALLAAYGCARLLLVPAILCCHLATPHLWAVPLVFRSDAFPAVFCLLLGLTNGHLGTMLLMYAPSLVPPALRERSGTLMAFSVTAGLAAGTAIALVLLPLLQHR